MAFLEQVFIEGSSGAILDGPAGTPTPQAITIQGNASGTPVPISGAVSIPSPVAVTGTFFQATQPVSGTISISNFPATQPVSGTVSIANFPASQVVTLVSTTITGTVAVTQSTTPWIVAGGGTAGAPGTAVLTVQGVAGGTAIPISGTVTITPSGLQNVNLTQLNSVALGSPSNYGTSPGAVEVQGVNAFVTNTVATTLASTTITGTVAVTQSTSPWVVAGGGTAGAPGTSVLTVQGIAGGTALPISGTVTTTPSGLQNVNLTELNSVALGSPSNYGTSPGAIAVQGVNAFITNTPAVTLASTTITGTVAVTGTFFQTTQPVSIAGTVAVTQSTSPWVISGTVTTTPPANASTNITEWDSTALGVPTAYGTAPTTGNYIGVNAFITNTPAVTLASTTITGTVAVTQSTSPWAISGTVTTAPPANASTNITEWDSVALGSPSAYGTSPGAVEVIGVNAFITNTPAVTLASTTITGTVAVTQSTSPWIVAGGGTAGAPGTAALTVQGISGGTAVPVSIAATIQVNNNVQTVSGTAVVAASAGVQKVGISGATGATLDAVNTAATAPANGLLVLGINETTAPSLTTGQSVALQVDYEGNLFTRPFRRSGTVVGNGTFTSATATSFLAAQASGIFADLSSLVITVGEGATAAVYFTVNLSDGTATYKFNFLSQIAVTGVQAHPLVVNFNPPLPATSAATAWTIALSSATDTPTVNATGVFVLQKAS
jgi:hypothetical protein